MNPKKFIGITSLGFVLALLAVLGATARPAYADGNVTDCSQFGAAGMPGTLAGALSSGGTVTFECSGTIEVTTTITIESDTTLDGSGQSVTLSGGNARPVFSVNSGLTLNLSQITVANGYTNDNNAGGGLLNLGTTNITNTTFYSNTANRNNTGGAIHNAGTINILNSTFSENSASGNNSSGVLFNASGTAYITNTTIVSNTADGNNSGGVRQSGGAITLFNTIVADNAGGNCFGAISDGGYNLDSAATCLWTSSSSLSNTNPLLGPLQDNGGSSLTHALLSNSPAADRIPNGANGCGTSVTTDQRGVARPQGASCDMGAYEANYHTLSIASDGNGSGLVTPALGTHSFITGTVVSITATASISSTFTGWSGDLIGMTNPANITLDGDKIITATFMLNTYIITPTAGAGGSITPDTPQIVDYGASQTFTITADTGYHIADVGVDGVSQGAIAGYTFADVQADHTITAAFDINTYVITPTAGAGGSITPDTPQIVDYGASQTFTITADAGYHIADVGVDGVSQGAIADYSFADVQADHTITAAFDINIYTLSVNKSGTGTGTVSSVPSGIGCGDTCAASFAAGTSVTLTAAPATGSTFAGWSANCTLVAGNCVVPMTADTLVTATFAHINQAPIAKAGPDQKVYVNSTVTLNGSASYDPDNNLPLRFLWTQTGGTTVGLGRALSVTMFTAPATRQVLTFTLIVTDSLGLDSTPDTVVVTVRSYSIYLPIVMRNAP